MINILKFFSNSNNIESGGANVKKYEFKIYTFEDLSSHKKC